MVPRADEGGASPPPGSLMRSESMKDPPTAGVGLQTRKIRLNRWLTKQVAEYDIDHDYWQAVTAETDRHFLAFSRSVYLPN